MPFNLRETIGGINHLRFKWERLLFARSPDYFIDHLVLPPALAGSVRILPSNNTVCLICGYTLTRLEVSGGWLLETCSATSIRELLKSTTLPHWLTNLPTAVNTPTHMEQTRQPTLPGPGN